MLLTVYKDQLDRINSITITNELSDNDSKRESVFGIFKS